MNKPKRVFEKISLCLSLVVVTLLISNRLITFGLGGGSSLGRVLIGTSLSLTLGLITLVVIWYIYNYVRSLLAQAAISIAAAKAAAVIIIMLSFGSYLALIWYEQNLFIAVALPVIGSYLLMYVYLRLVAAKNK